MKDSGAIIIINNNCCVTVFTVFKLLPLFMCKKEENIPCC